ncbi:hypothetical protein FA13DRAFT_669990 [Coprinellus micaceus]|uniref:Xylosidase/arabinosidase n=1 Tax=Coprinellus micaceus TaxID=71717 RepID=A0A4Y7T502_COPMI|nr:hypothetical protein FA13DRAFT_669990 [Coprinellus micaceus]
MVTTGSSSSSTTQRVLKRANPNTIKDKFLVGYQGWFTCAGDGEPVGPGHHGWLHWFDKPIPDGGRPNLDIWPDVSSYGPSELYQAPGLKLKNGEPAMLFSSRNAQTVKRHFHWMAEHSVDGAFLQRFAGQCDLGVGNEGIRRIRDEVGDRVREAAEQEGRVFAIMYDVTGVPADRIQRVLEHDWMHLVHNKRILDSPNYLREQGRPVVALWGFGFEHAGHTPHLVRSIAQFFRNATPAGVYLMGGTPTHWRTAEGDADRNPEFIDVWLNEFDALSPWTIGRYKTEEEAEAFCEHKMRADADLITQRNEDGRSPRRIDYIPVVFPGGSGFHLSEGRWAFNDTPRKGGRFLWKQVFNARSVGARIIYGAMWDEYDEGTALIPAVVHKRNLPVSDKWTFLSLDHGGYDVPSDWYMRICGFAAEVLRGERRIFDSFPSKELQDYWSSRPKYEEVPIHQAVAGAGAIGASSGAGSSSGGTSSSRDGVKDDGSQSYEEWLAMQKTSDGDEAPPPPYSLEVEELDSASPATQAPAVSPAAPSPAPPLTSTAGNTTTALAASGAGTHHTSPPPVAHQTHPQGYVPHTQSTLPATGLVPPMNQQSRPQNYGPQSSDTVPQGTNVTGLTNDFNRMNLPRPTSSQGPSQGYSGPPGNPTYDPGRMTASPPPLHSTHPAAPINQVMGQSFAPPPPLHPTHPSAQGYGSQSSYGRPPSRPQTQPTTPTGFPPRPPSQGRPTGGPNQGVTNTATPPLTLSSSTSSQGQWPPPEWGSQRPSQTPQGGPGSQAPPSQYGQTGGANLSRPSTFSANSYGPTNPLRPSGGTIGPPRPSTALPHASGSSGPSTAPGGAPSASNPGVSTNTGYGPPPPIQHSFSGPPSSPGYSMPSGPSNSSYPGMPGPQPSFAHQQTNSGTIWPTFYELLSLCLSE